MPDCRPSPLAELELRINGLEARIVMLERLESLASQVRAQAVWAATNGCVCPVGAEKECKGLFCPRQRPKPI